ncbi:WXG100 family type VII secretion target [Streptomyces spinosisporus]|uniref:WXG100 family type VII secretion target n=1 Tax=Streptomyces spinosisporus TaxID=2927582 RepID=A0ABS9XVF4_9ACTN|nr:WXG100 family type VII secretion target [Streptomyces spinosisporus]MCI3246054.1 WXG100 family type VII secretion target [Streptomyces spinosisporus]
MTTPVGDGGVLSPEESRHSNTLADLNRPQGLQTDPGVSNSAYPHLGFNPAPGDTEVVRTLHRKLTSCVDEMQKAHSKVTRLLDGSYWEGDAAVAFRQQLEDGPLPTNLRTGARSVGKAAKQLRQWTEELEDFQRRAKKLEGEAKNAREVLDSARRNAGRAKRAPALDKGEGRAYDEAKSHLTKANAAVTTAQHDLDDVLRRARSLAEEHERAARHRAKMIRDSTGKLAPDEPGAWDNFSNWVDDNLEDILSGCAAILGVIALFALGPVAGAVLLVAAAVLSGAALYLRLSDPAVRASLWDGFSKGELDLDFWSNVLGVTGDILGVVPGLGAVVKGGLRAPAAIRAAAATTEGTLSIGQRIAAIGTSVKEEATAISEAPGLLEKFRVFGAQTDSVLPKVEKAATWLGAGTSATGLVGSAYDALDSDGVKVTTSVLDGARTAGIDLTGASGVVRYLVRGAEAVS